jgi:hypothetical protein
MTKWKKKFMWFGLVVSLPVVGYMGLGFIFYSWLNAAVPERWSVEKAATWAYGSLILAVLFLILFIYCLVSLIKESNKKYKKQQNAIKHGK